MTTANEIFYRALDEIQRIVDLAEVTAEHGNAPNWIRVRDVASKAIHDVHALSSSERITRESGVPNAVTIQADLVRAFPQGWVLAWAEQVPGAFPTEKRWGDSCASHGSVSQTLGLAVFLTDSIKKNIVRRQA